LGDRQLEVSRPLHPIERAELRRVLEHDLKSSLSVISGYAELLQLREDEASRREAVRQILEAVDRLRRELDELASRLAEP
jgi:signal transduction histidine kinase